MQQEDIEQKLTQVRAELEEVKQMTIKQGERLENLRKHTRKLADLLTIQQDIQKIEPTLTRMEKVFEAVL